MAFFGLIGNDKRMAATTYKGRESASARRDRLDAEASARRRARAKRTIPTDARSGGGEAFADRNAPSITRWFRS